MRFVTRIEGSFSIGATASSIMAGRSMGSSPWIMTTMSIFLPVSVTNTPDAAVRTTVSSSNPNLTAEVVYGTRAGQFDIQRRARLAGASILLGPREGPAGWRSVVATRDGAEIAFWQQKR